MEENNVAASEREAAVCDVLLKISVYKKKKEKLGTKLAWGAKIFGHKNIVAAGGSQGLCRWWIRMC